MRDFGELMQNDRKIKAKRGNTRKFKNWGNAKLGGLVKELGFQIVTLKSPFKRGKTMKQNNAE